MERIKLAPKRKRPRRVARKFGSRHHVAHFRDLRRCLALTGREHTEAIARILSHACGPTPTASDTAEEVIRAAWSGFLGLSRAVAEHINAFADAWQPWPAEHGIPRLGQPTPDSTARIDAVRITGDTQNGLTCTVFAELHREIMTAPTEPAPDAILLPDTPTARAAAAMIDELNAQHGSPKRSRLVGMSDGCDRVFRPETVKRISDE